MSNPLNQYFRIPKLYVKLPSQGIFYHDGDIELTSTGELAVYPLTTIDHLLLKTPDALLNGETLLKIISNCVPGVKNVKMLVEPDINTLILAIRVASNGAIMEVEVTCPSCKTENMLETDISATLQTQSMMEENSHILDFNSDLKIYLRPYDFEQRNLQLINELDEIKAIKLLTSQTEISDTERMALLAQHVSDMADRTFKIVARSIQSIVILKTGEKVTDETFIFEFLKGLSKPQADIIIDQIKLLNRAGIENDVTCKCSNCAHEWEQRIDYDPTSFFG
jgi:phage FluMu protein Com